MKPFLMITVIIFSVLIFASCYYDKAELLYPDSMQPCDTSVIANFSSQVLPVMNASCNSTGCHNSVDASGGVILDTYTGVRTQALNGRLMGSMNQTGSYAYMPKGGAKLSNCTLLRIQKWIDSGTPNN